MTRHLRRYGSRRSTSVAVPPKRLFPSRSNDAWKSGPEAVNSSERLSPSSQFADPFKIMLEDHFLLHAYGFHRYSMCHVGMPVPVAADPRSEFQEARNAVGADFRVDSLKRGFDFSVQPRNDLEQASRTIPRPCRTSSRTVGRWLRTRPAKARMFQLLRGLRRERLLFPAGNGAPIRDSPCAARWSRAFQESSGGVPRWDARCRRERSAPVSEVRRPARP